MGYGVVRAGMTATTLEKIHSYCPLTLPTLRLDLIFLLQTVSKTPLTHRVAALKRLRVSHFSYQLSVLHSRWSELFYTVLIPNRDFNKLQPDESTSMCFPSWFQSLFGILINSNC